MTGELHRRTKLFMATVNQLIETILENIEGTKAGDLGLRARLLREAGYLPTGKRGGGSGLAHVNSEHCANFIIGLIASTSARGVVPAVKKFRDLPVLKTAAVDIVGLTVYENKDDNTPLLAIKNAIDNSRAGNRPWAAGKELAELIGYCDSPDGPVILSFRDTEPDEDGRRVGWWLLYGNQPEESSTPHWAPMLSVSGEVVGLIVKLLGPIE